MKCVEITLKDDGSLSVVECEPETPAMEGQEGEGAGQSFNDIESAMQAAEQILTADRMDEGKIKAEDMTTEGNEDAGGDQFSGGFKNIRGNGLNG